MSLSKLFIGLSVICFISAAFFYLQRNNPQRLAFALNNYPGKTITSDSTSVPLKIIIPVINLNLPVIPARLDGGKWEATDKGASWLSSSSVPGREGNSILYGHNWPNLLGKIIKLKPGQVIKIQYSDGSEKNFTINATETVSPDDVNILKPSKSAQITLYTCTGFLDDKRFIIVAKLTT